jgi:hypothetical protein
MDFFLLWITTRIKERGWPKSRGVLRRRKFITEEPVVAAMQDAVRVACTIGGSLPDTARAIAGTYVDPPITQGKVNEWIERASALGSDKMESLSDTYPGWLRLCSITSSSPAGNIQHRVWQMDDSEYDPKDTFVIEMYKQATAMAGVAMAWTLRHPSDAKELFQSEVQELLSAEETYSVWLHMAEGLVSRYSRSIGFQSYDDLPS